ncbi:MAG: carboxynorspermidine decarboxylase [Desulfonauticus sp.]|nr:carboxynorspermidine decarboxylase [Desulfonauticus sp.]
MLDLAKNALLTVRQDFPESITNTVSTPCYLISEQVIRRNCRVLLDIQKKTGAKILLALKAFFLPDVFPVIREYLCGVCASGLFEARAGKEFFGKEVHTFSPAYKKIEIEKIATYSTTLIFNSIHQLKTFVKLVKNINPHLQIGLRINPLYSEIEHKLYDPCQKSSRFGVLPQHFSQDIIPLLDGLHFHALCEQNSDVLSRVIKAVEHHFGQYLPYLKWINLGGGHHITRIGYDKDLLCELIIYLQQKYNLQVYLEPGEAVVLNAGVLVSEVVDIVENDVSIAILDTSAENHMPDVLAMPYRPQIIGAEEPFILPYTYRLGGITCLAGDIIGDYSFHYPLKIGQKLVFTDMALYSFVKNTWFNGLNLPALAILRENEVKIVRKFSYDDFIQKYT